MTTLLYIPGAWWGDRASRSSQGCATQDKQYGLSSCMSSGVSSHSVPFLPFFLVQQERKCMTKRSVCHQHLRWPLQQSSCCVRALQIKVQFLLEPNTTTTSSPSAKQYIQAGSHPIAANTLVPGKQRHFLFLIAVKSRRSHLLYSSQVGRISLYSSLAVSYYAPYNFCFAARVAYVEIGNANKEINEDEI